MAERISHKILRYLKDHPGQAFSLDTIATGIGLPAPIVSGGLSQLRTHRGIERPGKGRWMAKANGSPQPTVREMARSFAAVMLQPGDLVEVQDSQGGLLHARDASGTSWAVVPFGDAIGMRRLESLFAEMMRIVQEGRVRTEDAPTRCNAAPAAKPVACKSGVRLVQLRDTHGYTRGELAARLLRVAPKSRLDAERLERLERGCRPVSRDEVIELARAYSKKPRELDVFLHGTALYGWE